MAASVEGEARAGLQQHVDDFADAMAAGMKEMGDIRMPKRKAKKVITPDEEANRRLTKLFKQSQTESVCAVGGFRV